MNKDYENLEEIIDLCKEELKDNNQDTTAVLDIKDLKSLNNILVDYKRLQKVNEELKDYIAIAPDLGDEMTAVKYMNIRQEAYVQGRAEEQQKAEQIIYENYISKQEIKDKIEIELKKAEKDLQEAIRLEKEAKEKEEATLWWTAQIRLDERIKILEMLKGVKKDGNGD